MIDKDGMPEATLLSDSRSVVASIEEAKRSEEEEGSKTDAVVGFVMKDVERTTSSSCVALGWPSRSIKVTAGNVCVKTVG